MNKNILTLLVLLISIQVSAQFIKERAINVSIGYGLSAPYDNVDVLGKGFYTQVEYELDLAKWIDIRPYAGLIFTKSSDDETEQNRSFKSTTNAFLLGGKTRISAPIPWFAPYIEGGIGLSIGSFETVTPYTNIDKGGIILHIPFSLGVALGPKHNIDISLTYYFQPSVEQYTGAATFGISFPLSRND